MCILHTIIQWNGRGLHEIEFRRFWNAEMKYIIMFTPTVMVIKLWKMAIFVFSVDESKKNSHGLGKLFKCTWKILMRSLRKWYSKWVLELPFVRYSGYKSKKKCWVNEIVCFLTKGSSGSYWYISFLHFKTFKFQFHSLFHYVLVC